MHPVINKKQEGKEATHYEIFAQSGFVAENFVNMMTQVDVAGLHEHKDLKLLLPILRTFRTY